MKYKTSDEAKRNNERFFYPGICKRGHEEAWYVSNRTCVVCQKNLCRRWKGENKALSKEMNATWYQKNKEQRKVYSQSRTRQNRDLDLQRKYGITLECYESMLVEQKHKCLICECELIGKGKHTCVDHNHTTGKIRGILCGYCNRGLGHFKDDPNLLNAAISYLNFHNGFES